MPTDFGVTSATCVSSTGSCSQIGSTFNVSPVGVSFAALTVQLGKVVLPALAGSSNPFNITFLYNGLKVA